MVYSLSQHALPVRLYGILVSLCMRVFASAIKRSFIRLYFQRHQLSLSLNGALKPLRTKFEWFTCVCFACACISVWYGWSDYKTQLHKIVCASTPSVLLYYSTKVVFAFNSKVNWLCTTKIYSKTPKKKTRNNTIQNEPEKSFLSFLYVCIYR